LILLSPNFLCYKFKNKIIGKQKKNQSSDITSNEAEHPSGEAFATSQTKLKHFILYQFLKGK
jgi:hypothetical protein